MLIKEQRRLYGATSIGNLYLSSDEDEIRENFKFRRPRALYKARWMSKLLYCLKIHLLRDQIHTLLPKGAVFSVKQNEKIRKFVEFAVYCYIPWRVRCRNAASTPLNDFKLIKAFRLSKTVEEGVAEAATKAFSNHLWYFMDFMVPFMDGWNDALSVFFHPRHHWGREEDGFGPTGKRKEDM